MIYRLSLVVLLLALLALLAIKLYFVIGRQARRRNKKRLSAATLARGVTHPQIHVDYYEWASHLSPDEQKYLARFVDALAGTDLWANDLAMFAWSRSRETLKEKSQGNPR